MPRTAFELEHHPAQGERRIAAGMCPVERMRGSRRDIEEAERLLLLLRQTLAAWQEHRGEILRQRDRRKALRSRHGT